MKQIIDRESLLAEMKSIHAQYDRIFDRRIKGTITSREFIKTERLLNRRGTELRDLLGIGAKSVAGAYCKRCGKFFKTDLRCRDAFVTCKMHRGLQECHAMHDVLNGDDDD